MPIIPRYSLSQTSKHVNIEVSIPHVRVSTSTLDLVIVDGTEIHLYAPPTYLLKLTLPKRVVSEDDVDDSLARAATIPTNNGLISVVEEENSTAEDDKVSTSCAQSQSTTEIIEEAKQQYIIWTKEDLPKLQYNPEKNHGTLTVTIRKEEEGIWDDLDLLGRLQQQPMQKKKQQANDRTSNPLIKVIDGDKDETETFNDKDDTETSTSQVMEDLLSVNNENRPTYGLFQQYSNVFKDYAREGLAHEMLECPNPDEVYNTNNNDNKGENDTSEQQNRREMRLEMENEKFDSDRYLNDLCVEEEGDMIFDSAMQMVPHWTANQSSETSNEASNDTTTIDNVTQSTFKAINYRGETTQHFLYC